MGHLQHAVAYLLGKHPARIVDNGTQDFIESELAARVHVQNFAFTRSKSRKERNMARSKKSGESKP